MRKYPKLRNGPHAIGEALHRALQRTGAPFLSSEGVGYGANKYGNGAEVYSGGDDGYICIGSLNTDMLDPETPSPNSPNLPPFQIMTSENCRGSFNARFVIEDGRVGEPPSLFYIGGGKAGVLVGEKLSGQTWSFEAKSTRTGYQFKDVVSFFAHTVRSTDHIVIYNPPPVQVGAEHDWAYGFSYRLEEFEEGEWKTSFKYLFTLDNGNTFFTKTLSVGPRVLLGLPVTRRVSVNDLLTLAPYLLVTGGDPDSNWDENTDQKASFFIRMGDNGDGDDALVGGGDLVSMSDMNPHVDFDTGSVNANMQLWAESFNATPLADGTVLCVADSIWYEGAASDQGGLHIFSFDGSTCAFLTRAFMPGRQTFFSPPFLFSDVLVSKVIDTRGETVGAPGACYLAIGNAAGTSWEYVLLPFDRSHTGNLFVIDKNTLGCPMYSEEDQGYIVMQTKDLGQTWTRRGGIRKDAPFTDDQAVVNSMRRFHNVLCIRKNGAPAKSYPASPWLGDDRITPPWEAA